MHELLNRVLENGNGEVFMGGKEKYLKMENCVATAFFVSCSKAFFRRGKNCDFNSTSSFL